MLRWFEVDGKDSDVVVSSRVRLARNIPEYNFSLKLSNEDAKKLVQEVKGKIKDVPELNGFYAYDFDNLDVFQKNAMRERHVISPFFLAQNIAAGFVSPDENISIMLNEEDHIRIQAYVPGMDIEAAYENADAMDDIIADVIEYAYDSKYGYLTTCPSNVGTGMRASYMLHLPALSGSNKLNGITGEIGRFGLTIRGIYGEGSKGMGDIYQISNQITLGHSEKEIIDNLNNIVKQIIDQERALRKQYISRKRVTAEDTAYRSYGVLKYSRKMSLKDAMVLLSELRMGISLGLIHTEDQEKYPAYQLMIGVQPANLQLISGQELSEEDIEIERSRFIRKNIPVIQ